MLKQILLVSVAAGLLLQEILLVFVQEMHMNKEKTLYQDGWSENWLSIEEGCNRAGCEVAEHMPSVAILVQSNELSQWLENYYPGNMDFCCG